MEEDGGAIAPGPLQPLRGFCHQCEEEVVPVEVGENEFECPYCQESCVECPYDSFELWEGVWQVLLTDGQEHQLDVNASGAAVISGRGLGPEACQLVWAPLDHQGYLMRLDTEEPGGSGASEHLFPMPGGDLCVRYQRPDGVVLEGQARRDFGSTGAGDASVADAMGAGYADLVGVQDHHLQEAVDAGLEQLAAHWPGLSDEDREEMRQHLRQLTLPLSGVLAHHEAISAQYGVPGQLAPGLVFAALGPGGLPVWSPLGPRAAAWGPALPGLAFGSMPPLHGGAAEAAVSAWLDSRSFDGKAAGAELEQDWQCPICFDGATTELVAVCRDDAGRTVHAFHKRCVAGWLVRRDECPSCRRTPLVEAPAEAT